MFYEDPGEQMIKKIYKNTVVWIIYFLIRYFVPGNKHLMIKWFELKLGYINQQEFEIWMNEEARKINEN